MSLSEMERDMGFKRLKEENEQADFISSLPDEVLCHILSLLPTIYAVQTTILSSRWKNLWTSIYNLDFWDKQFFSNIVYGIKSHAERKKCFVNFVQQVLTRCQPKDIHNFDLTCSYIRKSRCFSEWINFAVDHNVHNLDLDIYIEKQRLPKLPRSLLTCKTLVELNLHKGFAFDIPDGSVVCFPSLNILHMELQCSSIDRVYQISKFVGRCSVLEELSLDGWLGPSDDILKFIFFVPTLKKLSLYLFGQVSELEVYVRAVNLEYLDISDDSLSCFAVNELPFIDELYVDYRFPNHIVVTKDEAIGTMELLKAISNAKFLSFSYRAIADLGFTFNGDLPTFPNLIHLQFDAEPVFCWKLLPLFLNNSPNLEVLILEQSPWVLTYEAERGEEPVWDWDESDYVPPCLSLQLKFIMIKYMSENLKDENMKMIKYLLKNSQVLEKLLVVSDDLNEIRMIPRASKTCTIGRI